MQAAAQQSNPTPKQAFYEAFKSALPQEMQDSIDEKVLANPSCPSDFLPSISSKSEAYRVVSALEEACQACIPSHANPFILTRENSSAYNAVNRLYDTLFLYLSSQNYPEDEQFEKIPYILCKADDANQGDTFLKRLFALSGFGSVQVGASLPGRPRAMFNRHLQETEPAPKDTGKAFTDREKALLMSFSQYKYASQKAAHEGFAPSIITCCRLPFTQAGLTGRLLEEQRPRYRNAPDKNGQEAGKAISRIRGYESAMKTDASAVEVNRLHETYEGAFRANPRHDLLQSLVIESIFKFLDDPAADGAGRQKYLPKLRREIEVFAAGCLQAEEAVPSLEKAITPTRGGEASRIEEDRHE